MLLSIIKMLSVEIKITFLAHGMMLVETLMLLLASKILSLEIRMSVKGIKIYTLVPQI